MQDATFAQSDSCRCSLCACAEQPSSMSSLLWDPVDDHARRRQPEASVYEFSALACQAQGNK